LFLNLLLILLSYLLLSLQLGCAETPLAGVWWPAIAVCAWVAYTPRSVSVIAVVLIGVLLEGLGRTPAGVQLLALIPLVWIWHEFNHALGTDQPGHGRQLVLLSTVLALVQPATTLMLANLRSGMPVTSGWDLGTAVGTALLTNGLLSLASLDRGWAGRARWISSLASGVKSTSS